MKQFLCQIRLTRTDMLISGPTNQESDIIEQHFQYLEKLVKEGVVLMAGRTLLEDENTFGLVIFETTDEQSAQKIIDNDPAVKKSIMKAHLFPYKVALWSPKGPSI